MKPRKGLAYVKKVRARGSDYWYFDTGKTIDGRTIRKRLPDASARNFGSVYAAFLAARERRANIAEAETMRTVSRAYQLDPMFKRRSQSTQNTYLTYLRVVEAEMGDAPIDDVSRADIRFLLDKMNDRPGAANMVLLVVRRLMKFALQREWIKNDPTVGIEAHEKSDETHEPWPDDLVEAALADPTVRLPVALLYFTAQRIGDVCKMRWNDIRSDYMEVVQQKTGKELDIRLHTRLIAILDATPKVSMTILHGTKLRPVRTPTLRLQLQRWADKRGYQVVPHGLRKNAVNALLEAGCSTAETSAISGQSLGMVERYAKRRNNRKTGTAAILKWENATGTGKTSENTASKAAGKADS